MAEGVKYGLIAQELEEVLPDLVYDKCGIVEKEDGTFYKSVFMGGVIPVLIEAVKELSAELEDLKNYVDHKQDYNSMAGRINSCEARIGHLEKG